ncbi:MAG: histidinol dehydrogenase [Alphaproteobacteria bacterium]|nr:histidinol dehydrogenase [Alphaproteobacteria bacterium]
MPAWLESSTPGFDASLAKLLARHGGSTQQVDVVVRDIIADIRAHGDEALVRLTRQFDRFEASPGTLALTGHEIESATAGIQPATMKALELAAARIESFHSRQLPREDAYVDGIGATLGLRWTPIDSVGLYVPGGQAAYPSSVLMNAIPARLAGVRRLVMVSPTPAGFVNPLVLAAARLAGIDEIHRIGGAQAVAALAFGTPTIRPVDKIVGPGNAYVAEAKRQVFGHVGIDSIAGPSEVLIIADAANNPAWIAADLLAQAEHDEDAQAILITDSAAFARSVAEAVDSLLQQLGRAAIAGRSWAAHGGIIVVRSLDEAPAIANRIAPEHLQLCTAEPATLAAQVLHAGAIFLGATTPEAIGDYVGGPNHVLPTSGSARFSSGLSVLDFMKRTTILSTPAAALEAIGPAAALLADAEGLGAHALSVRMRLKP